MTAIDPRLRAARIAARSQIMDIRLMSTAAQLSKSPDDLEPPLSFDLVIECAAQWQPGATAFIVKGDYALRLKEADDDRGTQEEDTPDGSQEPSDESREIASITFKMAALFSLNLTEDDSPPTEEELEAYAGSTAAFALYPFAREYVYDLTGRLGLPRLTLPVATQALSPQEVVNLTGDTVAPPTGDS